MLDKALVGLQGRSADMLARYFGEDPAHCPFEQGNLHFSFTMMSCSLLSVWTLYA